VIEERTVGPGLGADSMAAGEIAGIIGAVLVLCFMFVAYGMLGFIANLALIANVVDDHGGPDHARRDADLAGHCRYRADRRHGGRFQRSDLRAHPRGTPFGPITDSGHRRGLQPRRSATILDANVTTLIAAIILFYLGTGPVRGFAVTLAIGIVTTVFTAFTFTRWMVAEWVKSQAAQERCRGACWTASSAISPSGS
jgi:SecD/SecF fusion protein